MNETMIEKQPFMNDEAKIHDFSVSAGKLINDNAELLSYLYDADLLPEQLKEGSNQYACMLLVCHAFKIGKEINEKRIATLEKKLEEAVSAAYYFLSVLRQDGGFDPEEWVEPYKTEILKHLTDLAKIRDERSKTKP